MPPRADDPTEAQTQAAIVQWLRLSGYVVFHIPNGGLRGKREAARLKWQGVAAGVPDLQVLWRGQSGPRSLFIEVKTRAGRLSADQSHFLDSISAMGFEALIARSLDDVIRWMEHHG